MTINRIEPGSKMSVRPINDLIDDHNRLAQPAGNIPLQWGGGAPVFFRPSPVEIALFEITTDFTYPDTDGAATSYLDREPTPYGKGKRLWCHRARSNDQDASGNAIRSYYGTGQSKEEVLWHPLATVNEDGYAIGEAPFVTGDRILCFYNTNSARWEVMANMGGLVLRWGKLVDALEAGGTQDVQLFQGSDGDWGAWDQYSGTTQEGVYAPPLLTADQLDADTWVLIGKINGRWVVVLAACY